MAQQTSDPKSIFSQVKKISLKEKQKAYALTTCIDDDLFWLSGMGSKIHVLENGERRTLIDMSAGVSTKNIGYGNKNILKIVREQKDIAGYPHHDMQNENALNLAYALVKLDPRKIELETVNANSGTEGVEAAIKLCYNARAKSHGINRGRKTFIAFYGAFHGRTLGSLSLTCSKPAQRENYPTNAFPIYHTVFPARHPYFVYNDYGRIQFNDYYENEYVDAFKKACYKGEIDIDSVNAVVIELIQGEGGLNVASKTALEDYVSFLKKNGVYIIVDEIQTGLGRTGKMWAYEHFNIVPDVVISSKSLAYGWPFSVVIYRKDMRWERNGLQSSTFSGSPMGSAIALEVLRTIVEDNLPRRAEELGEKLGQDLRTISQNYQDVVHNTRGLGLMHGIEFWNPRTRKPAVNFRNDVVREARKRGVLFLDAGIASIRLTPPLTIGNGENGTPNELGTAVSVLEESVRAARRKNTRIT